MNAKIIAAIVLSAIISAGGIGGIIVAIVKFTSDLIAKRLEQKYELKLSEELERYKANVENKIYISKTKFDTEFQLYRQLSKAFVKMVKDCSQLFPRFTKDTRDDYDTYKKRHDEALESIVNAQDELYASAPFITKDLYNSFFEIESLCKNQLSDFQDFRLRLDAQDFQREDPHGFRDAYKRTTEIENKFNELLDSVRNYIAKLDVID